MKGEGNHAPDALPEVRRTTLVMKKQLKRAARRVWRVYEWADQAVTIGERLRMLPWSTWIGVGVLVRVVGDTWDWALLVVGIGLIVHSFLQTCGRARAGSAPETEPAGQERPRPFCWLDRATANEIMRNSTLVAEPPDYSRFDDIEWGDLAHYQAQQERERMLMYLEDFKLECPEAVRGNEFGSPTLQWWIGKKASQSDHSSWPSL